MITFFEAGKHELSFFHPHDRLNEDENADEEEDE